MQSATRASIGMEQMTTLGRNTNCQRHSFRHHSDIMVPVN
jgi:hypothetical protein